MATQIENTVQPKGERLNKLSVTAVALAVLAVLGLWFLGFSGLAIFAVGAGHVSLTQLGSTNDRGRVLSIIALAVGYGIGLLALFSALAALPLVFQSYFG